VTVFTTTVSEKGDDVEVKLTAEFFWKVFETTGSITAYLIYREIVRTTLG
jgi:predicted amino acid dehydrogenase